MSDFYFFEDTLNLKNVFIFVHDGVEYKSINGYGFGLDKFPERILDRLIEQFNKHKDEKIFYVRYFSNIKSTKNIKYMTFDEAVHDMLKRKKDCCVLVRNDLSMEEESICNKINNTLSLSIYDFTIRYEPFVQLYAKALPITKHTYVKRDGIENIFRVENRRIEYLKQLKSVIDNNNKINTFKNIVKRLNDCLDFEPHVNSYNEKLNYIFACKESLLREDNVLFPVYYIEDGSYVKADEEIFKVHYAEDGIEFEHIRY